MTKFEQRKRAIVQAAVEVISQRGVKGTSLGEVAARLELVPSAVRYYFRRKEALAAACYMDSISRFESFTEAAKGEPTQAERVRAYLHAIIAYWRQVRRREADPIILFNEVRTIQDARVNDAYSDMFRGLRRLLDAGPETRLNPLERNTRTHLFLTQAIWISLWADRYDLRDYPRIADRMADILIGGLAAPGHDWVDRSLSPSEAYGGETAEVTPESFLKAATALINEHGYRGASVEQIAARLNVTKSAFYRHHVAKDDLVEACFDRTLAIIRETHDEAEALGGTALEKLCATTGSLLRHEISGEVPLLRISALAAVPEGAGEGIFQEFRRVALHFSGLISDGIADGSMRPVDPNIAGFMITAMLSGATELLNWAPAITPDNAARIFVRPLMDGLFCESRV